MARWQSYLLPGTTEDNPNNCCPSLELLLRWLFGVWFGFFSCLLRKHSARPAVVVPDCWFLHHQAGSLSAKTSMFAQGGSDFPAQASCSALANSHWF